MDTICLVVVGPLLVLMPPPALASPLELMLSLLLGLSSTFGGGGDTVGTEALVVSDCGSSVITTVSLAGIDPLYRWWEVLQK